MIDILRQVSLFSGLNDPHLKYLADTAVRHTYTKNSVLFFEGDYSDSLYIILSGRLKAIISDRKGKEITLSVMDAGEYFGEVSLFDREPRSATIVSLEETQVLIISSQFFRNILSQNTDMAFDIIGVLIKRLRRSTDNIQGLAFLDVHARVVTFLLKIAKPRGDFLVIARRPAHIEIARMVNASREMVSRVLRNLAEDGWIVFDESRITIKKEIPRPI